MATKAASRPRGKAQTQRLRIVVTAGPTREHFDTVRFISNASSGRMGYAIAEAARDAGHDVILISGPTAIDAPSGIKTVQVISAAQMLAATRRAFRAADAGIFCAAVSDYRPKHRASRKSPKAAHGCVIELEPTADIAAEMGRVKGRRVTIGFALEDHAGRAHAASKLAKKRFDAIVLNSPANIGNCVASAEVLDRAGHWTTWPTQSKLAMARRIVKLLETIVASSSQGLS